MSEIVVGTSNINIASDIVVSANIVVAVVGDN